jgi:hypothetical protein
MVAPPQSPMDAIELQKRIQQMTSGGASPQQMADFAEDLAAQAHDDARRGARIGLGVGAAVLLAMAAGTGAGAISAALVTPFVVGTVAALGVSALICGVFGAMLGRTALALRPPPRELVASGIPARLTVRDYRSAPGGISVRTSGSSVQLQRVELDLDVRPAEGAPYQVSVREYLAGRAFVKLAPGAVVAGYVDRADPARIFIDWRAR